MAAWWKLAKVGELLIRGHKESLLPHYSRPQDMILHASPSLVFNRCYIISVMPHEFSERNRYGFVEFDHESHHATHELCDASAA